VQVEVQAVEQEQGQEEEEAWEEAKAGAWVDRLRLVVLPLSVSARNAGMKRRRSVACPAVP